MSRINDCLYGMIDVPCAARRVVKTRLFQRLGRVRQLGNLSRAWPSAVHTRLEHSLGAMHLADEYACLLAFTADERTVFMLAALLHDIAHGPFSHTFELAIQNTESSVLFGTHDTFRKRLLTEDSELREAVGDAYIDDIIAVWDDQALPVSAVQPASTSTCSAAETTFSGTCAGTSETRSVAIRRSSRISPEMIQVLHTLLAGVAGVDRMDYILRDSYHTTPQRRLDRTCVQSIMGETSVDRARGVVIYSEKGERFISHLLSERCYLYEEVYLHRRAVAADHFLAAVFPAVEARIRPLLTPERFEQLDDAIISTLAWSGTDDAAHALRSFLRGRFPQLVACKASDGPDIILFKKAVCDIAHAELPSRGSFSRLQDVRLHFKFGDNERHP